MTRTIPVPAALLVRIAAGFEEDAALLEKPASKWADVPEIARKRRELAAEVAGLLRGRTR